MKHFILIILAVLSFTLEDRVMSAASDAAKPIAMQISASNTPLGASIEKARQALVFHASNPRYAVASGVATVQKATTLIQRAGLPTLQPIRTL